uniref:Uncharacterized protein n=1 Tax=Arundo donax TaxID=35708 RepID=A0A0A9CY67_ARUDO
MSSKKPTSVGTVGAGASWPLPSPYGRRQKESP